MIGYRRSSNKLIVSTSWLSMCYSSKSSAGTWLLHFNSSLAKLTIYYSMCWLRSEKMNWLLIRVALRGHRGETSHSLAISVNGGLFPDWDTQGRPRSLRLTVENSGYHRRDSLKIDRLLERIKGQETWGSCELIWSYLSGARTKQQRCVGVFLFSLWLGEVP